METIIAKIKALGIQLVVWDFDKTIISCHSGGCLYGKTQQELDDRVSKLASSVSSDFLKLSEALKNNKIQQAIASFADQAAEKKAFPSIGGSRLIVEVMNILKTEISFAVCGMNPDLHKNVRKSKRYVAWHHVPTNSGFQVGNLVVRVT